MQKTGILIKSAESLELTHLVDTVILDKTGTITKGKPEVTDIITKMDEKEFFKIAGSIEKYSEHPLAEAIMQKVKTEKIELLDTKEFESVSGRGVKCKIEGKEYFSGNIFFMKENNIDTSSIDKQSDELLSKGKTVLYFADDKKVIGIIAVLDTIKDKSFEAIKELKNRNIDVFMITRG